MSSGNVSMEATVKYTEHQAKLLKNNNQNNKGTRFDNIDSFQINVNFDAGKRTKLIAFTIAKSLLVMLQNKIALSGYWMLTIKKTLIDYIQRFLTQCQDNYLLQKRITNNQRTVIYSHCCFRIIKIKVISHSRWCRFIKNNDLLQKHWCTDVFEKALSINCYVEKLKLLQDNMASTICNGQLLTCHKIQVNN